MHAALQLIQPLPLAATLSSLGGDPRRALGRLRAIGFKYVQLDAAQPGMRPRELDHSARRDLLATLRRHELQPAGLDLWIPPEHFTDPAHIDRAVAAAIKAVEFAADLCRVPLSMTLPAPSGDGAGESEQAVDLVIAEANRRGVPLADHLVFSGANWPREPGEFFGLGIDPAAWLSNGCDPAQAVIANASAIRAARLCDLTTAGTRVSIGTPGGRLDVTAYQAALSVAEVGAVVVDARQWNDPWKGLEQSQAAWHV